MMSGGVLTPPATEARVCGLCKGSGKVAGDPEPIPCPQCARRAADIERARRDEYSKAADRLAAALDEYVNESNETRELLSKLQRSEERRTRRLLAAILDIRAQLKGGAK